MPKFQDWQHLTILSPACRPCPRSLTDSSPFLFSRRAGSWPVSWWSTATRARSWAGRNLRRRKQLHRLQRLRRATLSTTGPGQCELNSHQPTTAHWDVLCVTNMGDKFTPTTSQMLEYQKGSVIVWKLNLAVLKSECGQWILESISSSEKKTYSASIC